MKTIILLFALLITGCTSTLGQVCSRFDMDVDKTYIVDYNNDIKGESYTKTIVTCKTKKVYK